MSGFLPTPSLSAFTTFLQTVVGIDPIYLPTNSPVIGYAYDIAFSIVNPILCVVPGNLYALAVYNLGADGVINYATDQPGQTYFMDLRKAYNINLFVPGVTGASSDSGTAQTRVTPEFMKNFTMMDLQNLKTPYGRAYLGWAQQYGTIWGLS
jgi:hypothetical protein